VNSSDDEDRRLVDAFLRRRDAASFRALYRRHAGAVYGLALRLSGGRSAEADDVTQEAWLRATRRLPSFAWRSRLRTWLCGIAVNVWRETHAPPPRLEPADEPTTGPPVDDVARIVAALPPGAREVLLLHDVEGFTHAEIAEMLGIEDGTSKSQLSRARAAVRAALDTEKS
jgi:RNA polymerase sigma-70 factor (ECF subfamily)